MFEGDWLTVPQVAERLQLRQETVRIYIKDGHLKAGTLPGGNYRVHKDDVEAFLLRPVTHGGR